MFYRKNFSSNFLNAGTTYLNYEDENMCPICKAKLSPDYISSSLDSETTASVFYYCRGCHNTFLTKYKVQRESDRSADYVVVDKIYSEPNRFKQKDFDEHISGLSSQFVKIYNQSLAAESSGLDEIAGLGYRKSLEFLVKDFAIHENPDSSADIKKMFLSPCIKKYIDNENIQTLVERSAWIGNDEAHYVRKQEDRDVSDMKSFIEATVYFIAMILITEDAASMDHKK